MCEFNPKNEGRRLDHCMKKEIEELNKEGFLSAKKSTGEIHVSLNAHRINEIKEHIGKYLNIKVDMI